MSGLVALDFLEKIGIFPHVRRRSFTSVHGVPVVILRSVLTVAQSADKTGRRGTTIAAGRRFAK
jgi:hypothetical protein